MQVRTINVRVKPEVKESLEQLRRPGQSLGGVIEELVNTAKTAK